MLAKRILNLILRCCCLFYYLKVEILFFSFPWRLKLTLTHVSYWIATAQEK